jgi:GLPGLI family protein
MKKVALLAVLFLSQIVFSQTTRFIYQVSMKPNSNDKTAEFSEKAYLDVSPTKSIFYGEKRMLRDSLITRMRATNNFDRSQLEDTRSKIDFIVKKDFTDQSITIQQRIARDNYQYVEDRKLNWKILPETTKIGEYKVQKAEAEFAGRMWTAWFAAEIPLQDGPYKFSGLPGLIIKVEDADGDYSFDLEQSKKIAQPAEFEERGTTITLKRNVFNAQKEKFEKDPMSAISSQAGSGRGPGGFGGRGGGTPDPQRMKEIEKRIKDEISQNNNPIEKE